MEAHPAHPTHYKDAEAVTAARMMNGIFTIAEFKLRKVFHDSSQVFVRAIQCLLWLVVFGGVFGRLRVLPTGDHSYLQFLTPGVLAQSVIFISGLLRDNAGVGMRLWLA